MYANLVKHASPDSPYEVFVLLHESSIEITQINRIRCDGQAPVRSDGGHGVAFYADRISDLGGVLTSENLDDGLEHVCPHSREGNEIMAVPSQFKGAAYSDMSGAYTQMR